MINSHTYPVLSDLTFFKILIFLNFNYIKINLFYK